jgi:hypothetical protein
MHQLVVAIHDNGDVTISPPCSRTALITLPLSHGTNYLIITKTAAMFRSNRGRPQSKHSMKLVGTAFYY